MRLRPLAPLRSLAGRRQVRPVRSAAQVLAPVPAVGRAGAASWHIQVHRHHTHVRPPRPALVRTIAAGPRAADGASGADGMHGDARVVAHRRERTVVERQRSLLRLVRTHETRAVERGHDGADGRDGAGGANARPPAPAPPPMVLRPATAVPPDAPPPPPPRAITGRADDDGRPSAATVSTAPLASHAAAVGAPTVDVERLAADVLDVIDRRVTAHRERLGSA